jgi:hypothetical protein
MQQGLWRCMLECRETIDKADRTQRHLLEHGRRFAVHVRALQALADEDQRLAQETLNAVESAEARARDAVIRTDQTRQHSRQVGAKAEATRAHWRAEAAVAAAERRVSAAQRQVSSCQSQVHHAEQELHAARAALAECLQPRYYTDSEGRSQVMHNDCSGCYARVAQAERALGDAYHDLRQARQDLVHAQQALSAAEYALGVARAELAAALADLADARAELSDARADLRHCESNLAKAEQAVQLAESAIQRAMMAGRSAQEASDAAATARVPAERAVQLNMLQQDRCEQLVALLVRVDDLLRQGQEEARRALRHSDTASDSVRACNNDLSLRVDHLYAIDRPHHFS